MLKHRDFLTEEKSSHNCLCWMGHTMEHCDVLRSGYPAEAAGLWHIGVSPEHTAAF